MTKIAILGYGAMGREVEKAAAGKFEITEIFDLDRLLKPDGSYNFDVAIDFTLPDAVLENARVVSGLGKNLVIGTTGWYGKAGELRRIIEGSGTGCVWGSNFSIGMHMFLRIVRHAAALVDKTTDYDIFGHEIHHTRKKDSPSGTAHTLADIILSEVSAKTELLTDTSHERIKPEQLHFSSTRGGSIPGRHTIYLDSAADTIELSHSARNRSGFAAGALLAADWLADKTGFHEFGDVMEKVLG